MLLAAVNSRPHGKRGLRKHPRHGGRSAGGRAKNERGRRLRRLPATRDHGGQAPIRRGVRTGRGSAVPGRTGPSFPRCAASPRGSVLHPPSLWQPPRLPGCRWGPAVSLFPGLPATIPHASEAFLTEQEGPGTLHPTIFTDQSNECVSAQRARTCRQVVTSPGSTAPNFLGLTRGRQVSGSAPPEASSVYRLPAQSTALILHTEESTRKIPFPRPSMHSRSKRTPQDDFTASWD